MRKVIKNIIFTFLPLVVLVIILEIFARCVYFQMKSTHPIALVGCFDDIRNKIFRKIAEDRVKKKGITKEDFALLYTDVGSDLLGEFKRLYAQEFQLLLNEVNAIQAKFVMLYLPSGDYKSSKTLEISLAFFADLAKRYHVDFVDMTDEFWKYPVDTVTLLPEDGHLSRFGNKLIVEKLAEHLKQYEQYRSPVHFEERPKLLGDQPPNYNNLCSFVPHMQYPWITNKQGFRMDYDLEFPKIQQRILVLGDSYTFGPLLYNFHTYPALLDKKMDKAQVINAGVEGYTITDETSLFVERAKYVEPDIVVLQVLDNDLLGFFYFKQNEFDRKRRVRKPSAKEMEFIQKVLASKKNKEW